MTTSVLICDDSQVARRHLERILPTDWPIRLQHAATGAEALEIIARGDAEVTFLDLTMPDVNGYKVLQSIREQDLPTLVIVVSADIQPEAVTRVKQLGAIEFIRKPADAAHIRSVLTEYGLL